MMVGLLVILGVVAWALVALCAIVLASANKEADRRAVREAAMFRVVTARVTTDNHPAPDAEFKALRLLERDAARAPGPLVGSANDPEMAEMELTRSERRRRDYADGVVDDRGEQIIPTGL